MALFRKAIEADPGYALTYNNIAVMYLDKKEFDKAIEYCDKAVSLGRADPALLKALKPYRKAGNE
jgi:stress-induced-phosphoprotein 1